LLEHFLDQKFKIYKNEYPFDHWILENFLNQQFLKDILKETHFIIPSNCELKRSENQHRKFFTSGAIIEKFKSKQTKDFFSKITNIDLTASRTRLELCVDKPGFKLEPHVDIPEKLLTFQLYISGEINCGTDLYPIRVPFIPNTGWLIKNSPGTIHGFEERPFAQHRISLILNYVNKNWWDVKQLFDGNEDE
jgi:hypothetical protein